MWEIKGAHNTLVSLAGWQHCPGEKDQLKKVLKEIFGENIELQFPSPSSLRSFRKIIIHPLNESLAAFEKSNGQIVVADELENGIAAGPEYLNLKDIS